jgi:Serine dehydrogenase proteinase
MIYRGFRGAICKGINHLEWIISFCTVLILLNFAITWNCYICPPMQIINNIIQGLNATNNGLINQYRQLKGCISIQVMLNPIDRNAIDLVYNLINQPQFQAERANFNAKNQNKDDINVIVDSFGGDADAAFHIAKIINATFTGNIRYIVPRFAKSAATLLVCGGDKIVMGETSELGPLDPQILQNDGRYISSKAVQSTLDLIKTYLKDGDKQGLQLATILSSRLNPLILGEYHSALKIAKDYQTELLRLRMFKDTEQNTIDAIVEKFAEGYTHHSRVISCRDAKEILGDANVEILKTSDPEWNILWQFYQNHKSIADLFSVLQLINSKQIPLK